MLDYEVPLKEKQSSDHGDIDVLCWNGDGLLITEVKAYNSKHSLLKAILQAFTYTSLVTTAKARFTRSFKAPDETKLIPGVSLRERRRGRQLACDRSLSERTIACDIRTCRAEPACSPSLYRQNQPGLSLKAAWSRSWLAR